MKLRKKKPRPVTVTSGFRMRKTLVSGVAEMVAAIAATYGPRGRTVMLDRAGGLISTKDGASVAWEIEPDDPVKRVGTRAVQEACAKVSKICGDGTTTTAILINALLKECRKWVSAGAHPSLLADDLNRVALSLDTNSVWEIAEPIPVEDEFLMHQVALSASNHDEEVASAIVKALGQVGSAGMVSVEAGNGRGITIEQKTGLDLDRGWESSDFEGVNGSPRVLMMPLVALVDGLLTTMDQVAPIMEAATQFPYPLVIVSQGCYGDALKLMLANDRKLKRPDGGTFEVVSSRVPGEGEAARQLLEDLAAVTGGVVLDPKVMSFDSLEPGFLGAAQTITVCRDSANFVAYPDKYELIERRVAHLRGEVQRTCFTHDAEVLRMRIAKLTEGFCVMKVGGATETEIRERRARIEDALSAVRVAVDGGVMPGAGVAYLALSVFLRASSRFKVEMLSSDHGSSTAGLGELVLAEALEAPLRTLARNAGAEPEVIVQRLLRASSHSEGPSWGLGWDAQTGRLRDLRDPPLLCDPADVVREAVLTATSTAATLLRAEVALTLSSNS